MRKNVYVAGLALLWSMVANGITVHNDPWWTANQMSRRARQISLSCQDLVMPPIQYNLPQFGWYIDPYGAVRENLPADKLEIKKYRKRLVEEMINAWHLPYYCRSNIPEISRQDIETWRIKNVRSIDKRFEQIKEAKEMDRTADVISYLACEYSAYGLDSKEFKTCLDQLNKLVKDKWMLGIFGGKTTVTTYRAKAIRLIRQGCESYIQNWNVL